MDKVKALFDTNIFGVMRTVRDFAPLLIAARGKIVNVGSVVGVLPYAFGSAYNATKAALHQYGDTLRVEMAPFGCARSSQVEIYAEFIASVDVITVRRHAQEVPEAVSCCGRSSRAA